MTGTRSARSLLKNVGDKAAWLTFDGEQIYIAPGDSLTITRSESASGCTCHTHPLTGNPSTRERREQCLVHSSSDKARNGWIPVSERLPEEKASVLVLDHSIGGAPSITIATYLRGLKGYNDQWMRMVQPWQSGPTYQHITHWMPLPEVP